jgi:hypothetical protein
MAGLQRAAEVNFALLPRDGPLAVVVAADNNVGVAPLARRGPSFRRLTHRIPGGVNRYRAFKPAPNPANPCPTREKPAPLPVSCHPVGSKRAAGIKHHSRFAQRVGQGSRVHYRLFGALIPKYSVRGPKRILFSSCNIPLGQIPGKFPRPYCNAPQDNSEIFIRLF